MLGFGPAARANSGPVCFLNVNLGSGWSSFSTVDKFHILIRQSSEQVANSSYIPPFIGTIEVITSRWAPNILRSLIFFPFPFTFKPYYRHYYMSFKGCFCGNFRSLTILYKRYLTTWGTFRDYLSRSTLICSISPSKLLFRLYQWDFFLYFSLPSFKR